MHTSHTSMQVDNEKEGNYVSFDERNSGTGEPGELCGSGAECGNRAGCKGSVGGGRGAVFADGSGC